MSLKIVYPSALEYWLEDRGVPLGVNLFPKDAVYLPGRKGIKQQVQELSFNKPVHIAVGETMNRKWNTYHNNCKTYNYKNFMPFYPLKHSHSPFFIH